MLQLHHRFPARLIIILSLNLIMKSLCFCLTRNRFEIGVLRIKPRPANIVGTGRVRRFSKLDDFMGDVDRMLADLSTGDGTLDANRPWRYIDTGESQFSKTAPSPVEEKMIQGRRVFIKRDDLLRLSGSQISGNKARKMLAINEVPAETFPRCVVSYGGPQSNSMLALAAVVNFKNRELIGADKDPFQTISEEDISLDLADGTSFSKDIRFIYYTKKLPKFLRNQPSGNLFRAMSLGMELVQLTHQEYSDLFESNWGGSPDPPVGLDPPIQGDSVWVPQGGAFQPAVAGASLLADEILSFWIEAGDGRPLSVCLPGGTCSTAVLLHNELKKLQARKIVEPLDIEVVVVPCVGDFAYARRQMMSLSSQIGEMAEDIPTILQPAPEEDDQFETLNYFTFGVPNKHILETFTKMRDEQGLVLDLIYGAAAWTVMLRHWNTQLSADLCFDPHNPLAGREIMYVHSGGLEGINSQLLRYKYEGLVANDEIQLPGKKRKE